MEKQQEARRRALSANPEDLTAKLGMIDNLINQGETEEAIKEYQALIKRAPQVRLPLAQLLIARNRRRPESADWNEVKSLIDDAAKAAPKSVEPVILGAELLLAQGKASEGSGRARKGAIASFPRASTSGLPRPTLMGLRDGSTRH